ncbi:MAG: LAGLIDADG family homing endonuclease [Dehalococcoidia bacterium]
MSRILTKDGKVWPDWKLQPPPEGSPGVGPWVFARYKILRSHRDRQGLVELWQHNHELLRGRIFKVRSKLSQTIANLFFKIHNSLKANLTDNKPRASILPNGQTQDDIADAWQARYDTWWEARQQQRCLQESVGLTELYGYQTDHMRFNPDLEGGLGEIETHRLGTYSYLSWPGHVDIQTAPGLCVYEAMELGEIYDRWPEAEDKVKADPDFSDMGEERAWVRANRSRNLRPMGSATGYVVPGEEGTGAEARGGTQRALVIQMWIKDYTMHWVDPRTGEPCKKNAELWEDAVDPETGQPAMEPMIDDATGLPVFTEDGQPALVQSRQRVEPEEWSKYPGFIRCIYVAGKGDVVLEDVPNPSINPDLPREMTSQTYLWDKFPFIKRLSYSDDISEYGLCYDSTTEILTKDRGWQLFSDLTEIDLVATRNQESKEFEWQKPTKITEERYEGPMVKLFSKSVDLLVTPKHRVLLDSMPSMANGGKKRGKWTGKGEVIIQARDILLGHNPMNKIPMTSKWTGRHVEDKVFHYQGADQEINRAYGGISRTITRRPRSFDVQMSGDDYCALMGAYIAEGNIRSLGGIEINQRAFSKGYGPYKKLIDRLGGSYTGKAFILPRKALSEHCKQFGKASEKYIPSDIMDATSEQIRIFLDHYLLGDGRFTKRTNLSGRGPAYKFRREATTTSNRLADQLMELAQKVGWSASITEKKVREPHENIINGRPCKTLKKAYIVRFRYSKAMGFKVNEESYSGTIHCVSVPNGIVYVRRNGRPAWCGNCVFEQIETLVIEICKKLTQYGVHLERTCRNPLILPKGCGVKNSQTNNLPARIWEPVAGLAQQIRFLEVPQTPNDLLAFIELCIRLVDMVTGITEVSEGRRPTGVTAGVAIAELQEKAQVAYRIKIRNNDTYLEEQGRMFIALGQNWYTDQEYLRYEGKGAEQMLAFRGIDYQGDLAFHMEAGSTLPRNRAVRQQQVLELAKSRPNFPNKALLKELSVPNADELAAQMDAGPLGMAMQKLQQSGLIPDEVLQTIDNLMKMDDKTFSQNFGSGNPLDVAGGQG